MVFKSFVLTGLATAIVLLAMRRCRHKHKTRPLNRLTRLR